MQSLWMLLACAMFAVMGACIKVAADFGASLSQIVLFRGVPSVLLLAVWALGTGRKLRPPSWKLHLWRNLSGVSAMWLSFYALSNLPLPTAISLNYTSPLFITGWMMVSGASRRDRVRSLAVILGFLGVVGILRPSIGQEHFLAGLLGLCGGCLAAVAMLQVRQLGRLGEPEWRTVLIFSSCVCATSVVGLSAQGWDVPSLPAWLGLVGLGASGMVGQLAMTRAFGHGSTLLTAALQYTTIIFAAMLGIVFWGDRPDSLAWAGMALIIGSGLLSTWRTYTESRKRRAADRPNGGAARAA